MSKNTNKVIFLFQTMNKLKLALAGLNSSCAKLLMCCLLTGTSSRVQPKYPMVYKPRATVPETKTPHCVHQSGKQMRPAVFLI